MELQISLDNLIFYSYHGVYEEERKNGNEFRVSVNISIPYDYEEEDDLKNTVSYADLFLIIQNQMEIPCKLLETVAIKIIRIIKERYPQIIKGKIEIEKIHPPIPGMLGSAKVTLFF